MVSLGLPFGTTIDRFMTAGTLHGKASLFRYIFASSTSRACHTDMVTRLSSRRQNVHCEADHANEGTPDSEEIVGVFCARNDIDEKQRFAVETKKKGRGYRRTRFVFQIARGSRL